MSEILERKFKLSERGTNVKTEMVAGLTTFLSCVSIVAINPLILSAAGMDIQGVFWATALSAVIACIWMGLYTNFPFALGPAMGLNSFFVYYCVMNVGMSWQNALACVCISGCTFMLLSFFGVQQKIVDAVPGCIRNSVGPGIGLFIAFTGLTSAGIVVPSESTTITIGDLGNPGAILALLGILLTVILTIRGVKGSILIGIAAITILGIFVKDPSTGLAYTQLPEHFISWENPVVAMKPVFGKLSFDGMFSGGATAVVGVGFAIVSFLFVDLFDSIGVLLGVASKAGLLDKDGKMPGAGKALMVSAGGAAIGAVLGTSTVTIYGAESTTGIAEGGRTGLTPCVTGALFILTLFFSPVFLMIPSVAITPALVMVGIFMMEPLKNIDLSDFRQAMPAFFAMAFMTFTYNIAYGILFAFVTYTLGQIVSGNLKKMNKTMIILGIISLVYIVVDMFI